MKKEFDISDLNVLDRIQPVDAPPFLLTRIQAKIASQEKTKISTAWSWTISLSLVFVILLNISVVVLSNRNTEDETTQLAKSLQLISSNTLYNE